MALPQRFCATVDDVEKRSATEDNEGNGVGTTVGGSTTATAKATAEVMVRAAQRGDDTGAVRVARFLGQPNGVQAAEAPA